MKTLRSLTALLSFALLTGLASAQYNPQSNQQAAAPPPQDAAQQAWDAPPPQFAAAWRRGYRDGVAGARKDFDNHRQPDVNNRDGYRHPKFIRPPDRNDYRAGFREGYRVAVQHIYGSGY